ncbi:MAG: YqeG family HAD IIIA-type phosphatase, partial [Clostridia bacterium]|nr:YqeG family HAD IIIA-type phosphatase [Clostridia bacterium]
MRFAPDRIFDSISEITPKMLASLNIKGLILDIDNTMAPRNIALPDALLIRWISVLKEADVRLYIISNNWSARVKLFSQALGVPFIPTGMKPFPFSFLKAVSRMELPKDQIAAVGDQIYTDIVGAHLAGIEAWLVMPIDRDESLSIRFRRHLERPVIEGYRRNR